MRKMAYPYYGPAWYPQPPPCETKKGVHHLLTAMYLSLVLMILALTVLLPAVYYMQQALVSDEMSSGDFDFFAVFGMAAIIVGVIGLVTFILYLMGLVEIHKGMHEFGPAHAKSVQTGILLILAMIVITVIGSIVSAMFIYMSLDSTQMGWAGLESFSDAILLGTIVSAAFSIVSAACQNLAILKFVFEISNTVHKSRLWQAFWIIMVAAVAGAVITIVLYSSVSAEDITSLTQASFFTYVSFGLSAIGFVLFIVCYRDVDRRLASGELKPIPPPMPPPMPMYAPGAYYPPPAYYCGAPPPVYQQPLPAWQPPAPQSPPSTDQRPGRVQPPQAVKPQPGQQTPQKPAQP